MGSALFFTCLDDSHFTSVLSQFKLWLRGVYFGHSSEMCADDTVFLENVCLSESVWGLWGVQPHAALFMPHERVKESVIYALIDL